MAARRKATFSCIGLYIVYYVSNVSMHLILRLSEIDIRSVTDG